MLRFACFFPQLSVSLFIYSGYVSLCASTCMLLHLDLRFPLFLSSRAVSLACHFQVSTTSPAGKHDSFFFDFSFLFQSVFLVFLFYFSRS